MGRASGLGLAVAFAGRLRDRRLLACGVAVAVLLVLVGFLRVHTLVGAAWAAALAAWWGRPDGRVVRGLAAVALAMLIPWAFGNGPLGSDLVRSSSTNLGERRADDAPGPAPPSCAAKGGWRRSGGSRPR